MKIDEPGSACCNWLFDQSFTKNEEEYFLTIKPQNAYDDFEMFRLAVTREEKELLDKSKFLDTLGDITIEQARDLLYDYLGRNTHCRQN
jgi:hypothetical protein